MSTIISPARETKVLFNHHAARLIKTIPPSSPPPRVNGHVPRDHLGPGHVYSAENETVGTVLQDWQGKLQLCAVPDIVPLGGADNDSHGGNLVLTIEQPYNALAQVYGAQRRQVLPFRSYAIAVSGDGAADAMPENTVPRTTFVGLGAGQKGQYGGSFWFFEDVSEPGAETRYRAEMAGRGKRAIWTAWLFDASPELVADLRNVLARFPLVATSSSKTASSSPPAPAPKPTDLRSPTKARRPLPVIPSAKKTDNDGEASLPQRTPLGDITNLVGREQQAPAIPHKPEELRSAEPDLAAAAAASPPTPSSTLSPPIPPASLRHSLVAVDDSTGAILAIVAQDVELSTSTTSTPSEVTPKPSSIMRPADVYRDHARTPSRKGSQLGADTFAPPPIPEKDAVEAVRDSMASANFFSAQEDVSSEGEEEEDGGADEVEPGVEDEVPDGFTSLTRKAAKHGIQSHRPDLLRDVSADEEDDDGAASDASGSTIGGPAVQLWRKARGGKAGEKKRAAKKAAKEEEKRAEAEAAKEAAEAAAAAVKREQAAAAAAAAAELEEKQKREKATLGPPPSAKRVSTATLEDLDPQELPASPSKEQADEARKLLLHGHVPRALMCTEDVVSAEDRIWREAIEAGHLPIDGAYTHLVAMPEATAEDEEDDLLRKDDPAARDAQEIRLPPRGYLQGGTVLIEFLAGGSRIGASLLGAGEADEAADADDAVPATKDTPANAAGVTGGVLSLIPALPSHFLAYFTATASASSSSSHPLSPTWQKAESLAQGSRNLVTTSVTTAMSGLSGLTSFALAAPSALLSWFAMPAEPPIKRSAMDEDEDDDDEWELAIPDFDPTSLASTPRPVYRRKRPAPSFQAGFNVRQGSGSGGAKDEAPIPSSFSRRTGQQAMRDAKHQQLPQRYSIIHFDGDGVGRRAFFKGGGGEGAVGHSPCTGPLGPL